MQIPILEQSELDWLAEYGDKLEALEYRSKRSSKSYGVVTVAMYEKRLTDSKKWRAEHPEEVKAYYADHTEEIKVCHKRYYEEHPAEIKAFHKKYYARHAEKCKASVLRWQEEHPGAVKAYQENRRALIVGSSGSFTSEDWNVLLIVYNFTCLCCGRDDVDLTADHVVPLAKGGINDITNIQPLCRSCNCSKHTEIIDYRPKLE